MHHANVLILPDQGQCLSAVKNAEKCGTALLLNSKKCGEVRQKKAKSAVCVRQENTKSAVMCGQKLQIVRLSAVF